MKSLFSNAFSAENSSSCASIPRPLFPIQHYADINSSGKSYEDSGDQSAYCTNVTSSNSQSRNVDPFYAKTCNFVNLNTGFKYSNMPTAIKESSNQEINRRVTLKLKSEVPEGSSKARPQNPQTSSSNYAPNNFKRRLPEESKPIASTKKISSVRVTTIKSVSFLKIEKGKVVGKRSFPCYLEDELSLPGNINKFLQKTENDDDVETDDETLEYYIEKVRKQLEDAVDDVKALKRKELLQKLAKETIEKENLQRIKKYKDDLVNFSRENRYKVENVEDFQRVRSKTLKIVSNK